MMTPPLRWSPVNLFMAPPASPPTSSGIRTHRAPLAVAASAARPGTITVDAEAWAETAARCAQRMVRRHDRQEEERQ